MNKRPNISAAKEALAHLELIDNPKLVKTYSRDFFWYSPVLKDRIDNVTADFVVCPRNAEDVIEVLKTCYRFDVPVTTRGAGTGNYGQAMPLNGGCVLFMRNMNKVLSVQKGRVLVEPGCLLKDLDNHCREHSGQELRMHSSTWASATIGGFIAGGSGGVGSVTWGWLSDLGNIIRVRVITMEATPRVLDFSGDDIASITHAYGTNGIITEIEMPLAPAYDWIDVLLSTKDFSAAVEFAEELAREDGILIKLASVFEAPTAHCYFKKVKPHVSADDHVIAVMVAPHSLNGFRAFLKQRTKLNEFFRSDRHRWQESTGPVFELAWNHTTLHALKIDPTITYLQVRYGHPDHQQLIETMRKTFTGEVIQHVEAIKANGVIAFSGLSLVKFTTEQRLDEIIQAHEDAGALIFNPHRYTLEEGGRNHVDEAQLKFKREADPKGLLNPGKMITWDYQDWKYDRMYDYWRDKNAKSTNSIED